MTAKALSVDERRSLAEKASRLEALSVDSLLGMPDDDLRLLANDLSPEEKAGRERDTSSEDLAKAGLSAK